MDRMQTMPGSRSPGPATPGSGSGNIPFAPGLMSGRTLGQQAGTPPQTPHPQGGITLNVNSAPEAKPAAMPPTPSPMQAPPLLSPDTMLRVMDAYMNALLKSVEEGKPLIGGIY